MKPTDFVNSSYALTDAQVLNFSGDDSRIYDDDIWQHFDSVPGMTWIESKREGCRLLDVALGLGGVEESSLIDAIISGVAIHAASGVWNVVATALGVNRSDLEDALQEFHFCKKDQNFPDPIGFDGLKALVEEEGKTWAAIKLVK